jgi:CRISPR/Cas system Type II protein with McrA/HNH and RuvC-like nuclease domain
MSGATAQPAARSRWLNWQPKGGILAERAESEPTKPSKPGSVGFEGASSADSPEIEAETEQARSARRLLNRAGVRIMILESGATIGVWSDLGGPEIRAALRTLGNAELPVRYLDGAGVPMRYKARHVEGKPVPMSVLSEMERHPADPWKVRDQILNEMGLKARHER